MTIPKELHGMSLKAHGVNKKVCGFVCFLNRYDVPLDIDEIGMALSKTEKIRGEIPFGDIVFGDVDTIRFNGRICLAPKQNLVIKWSAQMSSLYFNLAQIMGQSKSSAFDLRVNWAGEKASRVMRICAGMSSLGVIFTHQVETITITPVNLMTIHSIKIAKLYADEILPVDGVALSQKEAAPAPNQTTTTTAATDGKNNNSSANNSNRSAAATAVSASIPNQTYDICASTLKEEMDAATDSKQIESLFLKTRHLRALFEVLNIQYQHSLIAHNSKPLMAVMQAVHDDVKTTLAAVHDHSNFSVQTAAALSSSK
jgi:hypothetical protein